MAVPQPSSLQPSPSDSLPADMIKPDDMSYFTQPGAGTTAPKLTPASFDPRATTAPPPQPAQDQPQPTPVNLVAPPTSALPASPPATVQGGPSPGSDYGWDAKTKTWVRRTAAPATAQPQVRYVTGEGGVQVPVAVAPPPPPAAPGQTKQQMVDPPLGGGVNWTGETDVLKQRVDSLYAAMPPELRAGTQVESGYRTYQQQQEIYAESDQGQKFMAASPGHSHHEQGTALDWHFGSPQAKQWLYDNAGRFGLAFPFPDKDSGHMQLAEYGEGTQEGRAPKPGSANYLPELEKLIDAKEGGFPGAVSSKGAEGTHQILLSTAQEIEPGTTAQSLQDPTVNDRIFHKIVRNLSNRYPGDPQAVMVAYNAGPGVADRWIAANRDPSVLPAETQKYIGAVDMSAGGMPGYQEWKGSIERQRQTLDDENADLQRRMKDLEAGSPEQRALADQLLKKQIQLMDKYETLIAHPPTEKPHDMIANFGSIATLIGILGGRFAHRPMVASLSAAGAAMQAMNDNDYTAYQNAFKTWKTQTDMTSNLISMESNTYKNIMEDRRMTMDEKFKEMEAAAKIYQNRLLSQQLEAGEYEKAWEYAQKLDKAKDDHAIAQAQIEEAHAKAEKERLEAQFPLLGTGEQRSDLMAELGKEAEKEANNPQPGQTPRTVEQLAQDPAEVQAARQRIELRKKDKPTDEIQSPLLPTTGEERPAIITELGKQATEEVNKTNPNASPEEKQAAIKQRVQELANNYDAVSAARRTVEATKAGTRFGPVVSDEDATIRAGQLLKGDTTAMIRLSPESRDKVLDKVKELVMPQMIDQYTREEGHAPDEIARKNLLAQVGVQLASGRGEFTGFTQYQRSLAIRQASIDTAIAEAQKVIPIALQANDNVPRSQFPTWNSIQLSVERGTGGENVVKLNTATNSLAQIYARAVTPTGQATDLVRQKAYDNLTTAYSQGQYKAAIEIMRLEMDAAQAAPESVRQQRREEFLRSGVFSDTPFLKGGVGGGPATPSPTPSPTPRGGATHPTPPPEAIQDLKANPGSRDQFDQIFGPGAAARVLGQ